MEIANSCTKLIQGLLDANPVIPILGTSVLFCIFQIGVIHLLCVKQALSAAPTTKSGMSSSKQQRGVTLSEVLGNIGSTSWTSDSVLNEVVLEALAKADVHGRALKVHSTETKAGEGIWNLWEGMLRGRYSASYRRDRISRSH
ncbi:hypothetical protein M427DRAFT_52483 [Gonapodya prolifera JEL478]|uniref:Uncharacterized protein n=1 Tax=Gonapodya prolifera (strain JEL478) TaxID=1344416 RepID=A0A139AU60_GONPJ|nr:hypothetical protein M427DRAFT_52483 [Gonapodya prolifera JEL478]|eukprot:KXS20239.1 hypothetical protein M427DRAFT_52483 [Gonapodya prolifera JEL478]